MNRAIVILLALIAAATEFSCTSRESSATEIVFWAMGAEGECAQKLMPEFERRNPGVTVRVQMIPWNAAHEKLLTAFAGSSMPDLCQLGNTWIPEFVVLGAIDELTSRVRTSASVHPEQYFPGIWSTNVMDSVVYGIPWYVDTRVLFYRKDLLAEAGYMRPPTTWDEWFDLARKLKAAFPANHMIFLPVNSEWVPAVLMGLQMHSTLLRERDTRGDFSGKEFAGAMTLFHGFFQNGWAPRGTRQFINMYQAFAEGVFTMFISGPWNVGECLKRMPPELQDKWMTAPLPGPEGGIGVSLAGGSSLVLFKSAKHKEAAWKLMEYLSEPAQQLALYHLTGDLPGRREAWQDSALARNRYMAAFFEQLNHVVSTPKIPEWEQIAQKVRVYSESIAMDETTVEEALASLDRDVDQILEKRRWMIDGH